VSFAPDGTLAGYIRPTGKITTVRLTGAAIATLRPGAGDRGGVASTARRNGQAALDPAAAKVVVTALGGRATRSSTSRMRPLS
jgi:hypothetical protein